MVLFINLFCFPQTTFSQELYLIEGHQTLLYKVINWWYFAPSEDSAQLCGDLLEYKNIGNAKISFLENDSAVKISFDGGFASLLSVVDVCKSCSPNSEQAIWINDRYFAKSQVTLNIEELPYTNNYFIFIENVAINALKIIKENQKQMAFILTGTIQGLQNGKISLHSAGDFLGKCKISSEVLMPPATVSLVVRLSEDGPKLMEFTISVRGRN